MNPTAVNSRHSLGESSFFSGFLEKSGLNSLFRDLPDAVGVAQDSALCDWFDELLHLCGKSEAFAQALSAAAGFAPRPERPVFSALLTATASHRLSLLGIHPVKPIPLHDHPNTWSAQMILSGRAFIRHCDMESHTPGNSTLTYLRACSSREFGTGEISSVTPAARNIHSLAATAQNAVLLSVQHSLCNGDRQSWFFPVDPPRRDGSLLLCHRLKKPSHREIKG